MKSTYYHVSSFITLLLIPIHSISAVESSMSTKLAATVDEYIKECCKVTLYQSLCYTSLSSQYSGPTELGNLTCTAIKVSLTEATIVADYVASINLTASSSQAEPAVKDCVSLIKNSVEQVQHSLDLMTEVVSNYVAAGGVYNETEMRKMRFHMRSVQAWMSAGITDQNTCMDGFDDVGVKEDDQVEVQVYEKVEMVIKLISNALALINFYVNESRINQVSQSSVL